MVSKFLLIGAAIAAATAVPASAMVIAVSNASFETLPAGVLPLGGCGAGCSYSIDAIPGWTNTGNTGQFQPGSSSGNFAYFNYVPDGLTVAYSNGGPISQTVGATAVAGTTYTFSVAIGQRNDCCNIGSASLMVGANAILATGSAPTAGNWSVYTATYTATALDTGGAISIILDSPGSQGDFDAVSLTAVPEPASWALLIAGFGMTGFAMRRRRIAATV